MALVHYKSRRYSTILDSSFSLRYKGGIIPSVIASTVKHAPDEAMVQLGHYLQRIIHALANNYDPNKPFAFAKLVPGKE